MFPQALGVSVVGPRFAICSNCSLPCPSQCDRSKLAPGYHSEQAVYNGTYYGYVHCPGTAGKAPIMTSFHRWRPADAPLKGRDEGDLFYGLWPVKLVYSEEEAALRAAVDGDVKAAAETEKRRAETSAAERAAAASAETAWVKAEAERVRRERGGVKGKCAEEYVQSGVAKQWSEKDLKCSFTNGFFVLPHKSSVCRHTFSKAHLDFMFKRKKGEEDTRDKTVQCPVPGCRNVAMRLIHFELDEEMADRIDKYKQRPREVCGNCGKDSSECDRTRTSSNMSFNGKGSCEGKGKKGHISLGEWPSTILLSEEDAKALAEKEERDRAEGAKLAKAAKAEQTKIAVEHKSERDGLAASHAQRMKDALQFVELTKKVADLAYPSPILADKANREERRLIERERDMKNYRDLAEQAIDKNDPRRPGCVDTFKVLVAQDRVVPGKGPLHSDGGSSSFVKTPSVKRTILLR